MRTSRSTGRGVLLAIGLALIASVARAQGKRADAVRAEVLFEEGRRLMLAHDYAAACPRLAQSETLDPAPGTALNVALCYEQQGKLATAWAAYKTAQGLADRPGQKERLAVATKSAANLEPKLSRVTISVPSAARVSGLEVRFDGDKIEDLEWGSAIPRDGGGHDIDASAPGKRPWHTHIELQDSGARLTVEVPALQDEPLSLARVPATREASHGGPPAAVGDTRRVFAMQPEASPPQTQRVVGLVVGGLGLAGAATGVTLVVLGYGDQNSANCGGQVCGPGSNASKYNDGTTLINTGTVFAIAGGAATLAGFVLWLTSPSSAKPEDAAGAGVRIGLGPAGISASGIFR
ncbi:MAG: hypothetical protein ABTD50_08780 [Polyangiaceae bacterium]